VWCEVLRTKSLGAVEQISVGRGNRKSLTVPEPGNTEPTTQFREQVVQLDRAPFKGMMNRFQREQRRMTNMTSSPPQLPEMKGNSREKHSRWGKQIKVRPSDWSALCSESRLHGSAGVFGKVA